MNYELLKPNTIDEIEPSYDKSILQRNNAHPHVTASIKTYLERLNWEVLQSPPDDTISEC